MAGARAEKTRRNALESEIVEIRVQGREMKAERGRVTGTQGVPGPKGGFNETRLDLESLPIA